MINGGLGLRLANNTTSGKIAYGVIAGISGFAFLGLITWGETKDKTPTKNEATDDHMAGNGFHDEAKTSA